MILRKINVKYFIFLIIFLFITIMSYFFYKQNENKVIKKEAKIIATLGHQGWKMIENYNKNGANIFRINGSHIKSSTDLHNLLAEVNNKLKKSDLEYHNCIDCNISTNCCYNQKLNDICSFLPEMQKENDLFHKKFCELMNYIETNVEGNFK